MTPNPKSDMRGLQEKAEQAKEARKARGLPKTKTPLEKLAEKPASRSCAINAMCYTCQGGSPQSAPDAGWKWAIGNCLVLSCPLHAFRPYQAKMGKKPEGVYRWQDS